MGKILGGCLVVIVVAVIALAVAGYYGYRAARPMIDSASNYVERAREIARLGDQVADKKPFVPPKNQELTAQQVDRFVAVQTRVRSELNTRWSEVESKSGEIRRKTEGGQGELSFSELTAVFSDIASIYTEGRRAQVNALNVQQFSDGEYAWVRRRVYEAAGIELVGGLDMSAIEELAREGAQKTGVSLPDMPSPDIPDANIRLVKPHLAKLKEWLPMAFLGL